MRRARSRRPGFGARTALIAAVLVALVGCGADGEAAPPVASSEANPDDVAEGGDGSGRRVEVGPDDALVWGEGSYGVVLVHGAAFDAASWELQAVQFAGEGIAVLAVEDTSTESLIAAVDYLKAELGAQEVALLGASAGGAAVIEAAVDNPDSYDHLVLLSPAGGEAAALSDGPKFFVYSQDEGAAGSIEDLIADAPGDDNEVLEVAGSAHAQAIFETSAGAEVMEAILRRLSS